MHPALAARDDQIGRDPAAGDEVQIPETIRWEIAFYVAHDQVKLVSR
jgi:hypothetical protein